MRSLLFVHLILAKVFVVWIKGDDKLCIADLTLFITKGLFDCTILFLIVAKAFEVIVARVHNIILCTLGINILGKY